ncbi:MAG: hypothetical protein CMI13_07470 [Oleibacter sp.]|nr:hypothetical protein [Thalassolituus sp.]
MKTPLLILLTFLLNACMYSGNRNALSADPSDDPRYRYALRLTQNNQLADALIQWRILALVYPQDKAIAERVNNLRAQIDTEATRLQAQITQSAPNNEALRHSLQLRLLALKPDSRALISDLKSYRGEQLLVKAETKARAEVSLYQAPATQPSQPDNKLIDLLTGAEEQSINGDYKQLLRSAEAIEQHAAKHPSLNTFRYTAYCGLAEQSLTARNLIQAITYYENATQYAPVSQPTKVRHKIKQLRKEASDRLYTKAMKVFTRDIDQAMAYLNQAVAINPTHQRARQQLLRAETIQKNLNLIQQN